MALATFSIPVSNGIIDPRHRKKIGSAIWLFLLLIDWTTDEQHGVGHVRGGKPVKVKEMMEVLDLQERQVRDQLQRLKDGAYIDLKRTPYGYSIDVLKSKKWVYRDRRKTAALSDSDRQETPGLFVETGNNPPDRPAENCRCNILDTTVDTTKKSAHRKKRDRADSDPRVKTLVTAFVDKYLARVGSPYVVVDGKDPALLKRPLTAGHNIPAIEAAMDRYFADAFYSKTGFDVGGFVKSFSRLNSAGAKNHHNYEDGAFPEL
jgi:hypothetical protein